MIANHKLKLISIVACALLAVSAYRSAQPVCAAAPPPDVPCIAAEVAKYIDGVMGEVSTQNLEHIRYLSPAFNMTSPYFTDMVNGIASQSTYWGQLDGIAGNAYNFPNKTISQFVADARTIPNIGNRPLMLTEIGWYDFVAGADKASAQANLKTEIGKIKSDSSILGAQLFNVFNNNPGWSQYAMTNTEINDVCNGNCGKVGANSAGYYSHSVGDFYGPAESHGMQTSIEIANNDTNPQLPSLMPGINAALDRGITPVIRIGVMDNSGGFDDPADYAQFLINLNNLLSSRPASDIVYVIVGPNEPITECWAARSCFGDGCAVVDPGQADACLYSPWTPFCENVSTPDLFCACDGGSCDPFENVGFTSPNDVDVGQDDGTGKADFKVFDRDTETFYDVPPVLFYTSPGANACGDQTGINAGPPGGGPGGSAGGGTCNPFNCFGAGVVDFSSSLNCAAGAIAANIAEPTWYWFDRYGPYCHNETFTIPPETPPPGGDPKYLTFGYNFWNFFDTYLSPGTDGGRKCGQTPPSKSTIESTGTAYLGIACHPQSDPTRKPGDPAFDYFREALVNCPLEGDNNGYAKGSLGRDPVALREYLMVTRTDVNYQGHYLKDADPDEVLRLLEVAQEKNINPFILLGLWATESWFGQNGGCSVGGTGGTVACGTRAPRNDIAQTALTIANSLSPGYWGYYNNSSLYPSLFNHQMYNSGNTDPCLEFNAGTCVCAGPNANVEDYCGTSEGCPISACNASNQGSHTCNPNLTSPDNPLLNPRGCTGKRPDGDDLLWCTYTPFYAYQNNGAPITTSKWAHVMMEYFIQNGRFLPPDSPPCALRPGDVIFAKGNNDIQDRLASHVMIVVEVDEANGVLTVAESNSNTNVSQRATIVNGRVELSWGTLMGYGTPTPHN